MVKKSILYVSNTDWYFQLHWMNRALASIDAGYQVSLVTDFSSDNIRWVFEKKGIRCFHIPLSRSGINPVGEIVYLIRIYAKVKKIEPDIIHSITVKPNIYAGAVGRILKIPVIKSITGTGLVFSNQSLFFRCVKKIVIQLYRFAGRSESGAFVFENRDDQHQFSTLGISEMQPSILIHGSGVDPKKYLFSDNLFRKKTTELLFAARLVKDKGLDTLISGLDKVYAKRQDFALHIAGIYDFFSRNAYRESDIDLLTKRKYIHWLGKRDDIEKLLSDIDIVVLPTRYGEGIPRILIEAGFSGRVVVATNVAGCREIIEDHQTGYLLDPGNDEQLAAIVEEIMTNPQQASIYAHNLYLKVKDDYSDETIISRFLSLYNTLCKGDDVGGIK